MRGWVDFTQSVAIAAIAATLWAHTRRCGWQWPRRDEFAELTERLQPYTATVAPQAADEFDPAPDPDPQAVDPAFWEWLDQVEANEPDEPTADEFNPAEPDVLAESAGLADRSAVARRIAARISRLPSTSSPADEPPEPSR